MLVKYIGQKQKTTVWLPIGIASHSAWERSGQKTLVFHRGVSVPVQDAEAMKLVRLDPKNFELDLPEGEIVAEADVHEGLVSGGLSGPGDRGGEAVTADCEPDCDHDEGEHAHAALDGTELAEAMSVPPGVPTIHTIAAPKRRGRPKKAS